MYWDVKTIRASVHVAPEGHHVYSTRINKYPKAPAGRHVQPKGELLNNVEMTLSPTRTKG